MLIKFFLLSLVLNLCLILSFGDQLHTSTFKLMKVMRDEGIIIKELTQHLEDSQAYIANIKRYIESYRKLEKSGRSIESIVAHPIDAFYLIKRLTLEWERVEDGIFRQASYTHDFHTKLKTIRRNLQFPVLDDFEGASSSIVTLQTTYNLDTETMAKGKIKGFGNNDKEYQSIYKLNADDCLSLGITAQNMNYFDKAISWLRQSSDMILTGKDTSANLKEVNETLWQTIDQHDENLQKIGYAVNRHYSVNPLPANPKLAEQHKDKILLRQPKFIPKLYQHLTDEEEWEHANTLCRGEQIRPEEADDSLMCMYVNNNDPRLILGPLKIQQHSLDPYIVVFHHFVTEAETERLKKLAAPKLATSMHYSGETNDFISSMSRTSSTAWIMNFEDSRMLNAISNRIEAATGLNCVAYTSSESYQVVNYGIGGLFVAHTDFLGGRAKHNGDRIATLMIYLSDVELGGATVFTRAGVTLWPEKGSAAFWWNLFKDGAGDHLTRHAGCPVLYGSKWISNKWMHENDQMFKASCGLHKLDKFRES